MGLMKLLEPRRFSYQPRYFKPDKEKKVKFIRIGRYDPHAQTRMPWVYLALLVLAIAIIIILGGVRRPLRPPALTPDDAAGLMQKTK